MSHPALEELLTLAALDASRRGAVEITGSDPVVPTPFRVGTAAAAAVAAAAIAVGELFARRNGASRAQDVAVDLRHATAALRSPRYLRIDGAPPREPWDPLSGLYSARNGRWILLHCNFANHRNAALGALGLPADAGRDAVAAAVAGRDGLELEDALHAAGGCAGFVRSPREWLDHPQSAAVAALPLLELERLGDAPAEPLPAAERPLSSVRVLDLTRVLAGPTCARTLAEHGADVLKVSAPQLPHSGEIEIDTGLGKLSTFLDLRETAAVETLTSLIRDGRCDVFSQAYRPGSLAARGFGPSSLAALRPGIVCVELSAWGRAGPWALRRGFDTVVQCASGMAAIQGALGGTVRMDGPPRTLPVSAIDYVSGYLMAFGAIAALARRATEGGSWVVRVSLARTGKWIVDRGLLDTVAVAGVPPELSEDEIARITQVSASPLGSIRHLAPVARMSQTSPRWARPPVPLGHDAPMWPPRARG